MSHAPGRTRARTDRFLAEHSLPRTGLTHRRLVTIAALCAGVPVVLDLYGAALRAAGGWELDAAVGPRPWWNAVASAVVVALLVPGGVVDRRLRRRAVVPPGDAPVRASLRIGGAVTEPSLVRALWVAWWTLWVSHLLTPLVARVTVPPGVRMPHTGLEFIPALTMLLAWGIVGLLAARRWRAARLVVTLPDGDVRRGRTTTVLVAVSDDGARIDRLRVHLRALREHPRGPFGWFRFAEPVWSAAAVPHGGRDCGPSREVRVTFDVPETAPATDSDPRTPVYWEVLVTGTVGASDLAARFPMRAR